MKWNRNIDTMVAAMGNALKKQPLIHPEVANIISRLKARGTKPLCGSGPTVVQSCKQGGRGTLKSILISTVKFSSLIGSQGTSFLKRERKKEKVGRRKLTPITLETTSPCGK